MYLIVKNYYFNSLEILGVRTQGKTRKSNQVKVRAQDKRNPERQLKSSTLLVS